VFVVSSSQLGAQARHVANPMERMDGPRVRHYWDGDQRVGKAVTPLIEGLDIPAWDVWMLYAPGATWGEGVAPAPDWWEHQLNALWDRRPDRRLEADRFAAKAEELTRSAEP
jgi:hypothetical protein